MLGEFPVTPDDLTHNKGKEIRVGSRPLLLTLSNTEPFSQQVFGSPLLLLGRGLGWG